MTIFEITDSDGAVYVLDAEQHCIGSDEEGRVRHDFVPPPDPDVPRVAWSFTAPRSVREVPA